MKRPFAAFDIDGTLIRWQLYHAVTDALAKTGYLDANVYNKIRDARRAWKMRSHPKAFADYEHVMIEGFEHIIQKLTVQQFEDAVDSVIQEYKDQVYAYSRQLIKELKARGYMLFAISGSQIELVSRIAAYYGFDDFMGTDYLKQKDRFTGQKKVYALDKKAAVQELVARHNADSVGSIAVGDSGSDIPMLQMAEHAIAFNPEAELYQAARTSRWTIVLERKNIIYKLEPRDGTYILA
ncbi:MAG TPA: HAD family phosphatase [Candidatus Limnocylindrales bacterium]|nr:HAD family phosphatase [Candidatus Limnocylindrales bacterium]